ncbi:MAG: hypothetical protein WBG01_06760 [Bacteroidota bacterium]
MVRKLLYIIVLSVVVLGGCEERLDLATLPEAVEESLDTVYLPLYPFYPGYTGAQDIVIGNDQLLYVADTRANRLVMLNRAGQFVSAREMLHPISVAQDTRLDLLVGGEIVAANGDTVGAIFRIHLVSASPDSAHRLEVAPIDTVWTENARPRRRFPGITIFGDNTYFAVRTGPDNSSFIDPDGRVLLFDRTDFFITPVPGLTTRVGTGITDINKPTGIASFPGVKDFVLTQSSEGVAYGGIWMRYEQTVDFDGWLPRFDPADPNERFVDFIRPNRFVLATSVAIDRSRRDVFIADAELDSVFKFNSRGRFKTESFGFYNSGEVMKRPTGLAHFEKVLYVLDAEVGQIMRFRLSTDVPR